MSTDTRPRAVAVIPARGGSQGVPLKNLQPVVGVPIVARAVAACLESGAIDTVVVSTDHAGIAEVATRAGAVVVDRPVEISGHTATSESAVMHVLDTLAASGDEYEITLLVQCTSPFIDAQDLATAVETVRGGDADVVFSVVRNHTFLWTPDGTGAVSGINHDMRERQRRQDRPVEYRETGAFYVMRTEGLRASSHRFFGVVKPQVVADWQAVEIDEPADLEVVRAIARARDDQPVAGLDVDAVVTDFDGVHTDDAAYVDQDGRETVRVDRGDGMGVSRVVKAGVPFLILSTERNPVVAARARKLKVECLQGIDDKAEALRAWMSAHDLDPARVVYLGNDINDLGCLALVGWPVAVADAKPEVLQAARITLTRPGGHGAVRELSDLVLAGRPTAVPTKEKTR